MPANPQSERLTDILDAIARVSGAKGWKPIQAKTPLEKAWVSTVNAHPSLLTALTGWKPTKLSLVDGMDVYWQSYVASREEEKSAKL
jgi:folate-dependent phosphoribosylglycinamide formyltransferase PurN